MWNKEVSNLLAGTGDAAFVTDCDGNILAWNHGTEDLLGFQAAFVDRPCFEVMQGRTAFGSDVCGRSCNVARCVTQGQPVKCFDMEVRTHFKTRVWVTTSIVVMRNPRGNNKLILHILIDRHRERQRMELTTKMICIAREIVELPPLANPSHPVVSLTPRDRELLRLLCDGNSSMQTARQLRISPQTLRNRISQINSKMRTHNRLEAVAQARLRGII